jgi:hypothetical protein
LIYSVPCTEKSNQTARESNINRFLSLGGVEKDKNEQPPKGRMTFLSFFLFFAFLLKYCYMNREGQPTFVVQFNHNKEGGKKRKKSIRFNITEDVIMMPNVPLILTYPFSYTFCVLSLNRLVHFAPTAMWFYPSHHAVK